MWLFRITPLVSSSISGATDAAVEGTKVALGATASPLQAKLAASIKTRFSRTGLSAARAYWGKGTAAAAKTLDDLLICPNTLEGSPVSPLPAPSLAPSNTGGDTFVSIGTRKSASIRCPSPMSASSKAAQLL